MTRTNYNRQAANGIIRRMFRMIVIISRGGHTIPELAELLGICERTVYRYAALLEELGFKIEVNVFGHYRITRYPDFIKRIKPVEEVTNG